MAGDVFLCLYANSSIGGGVSTSCGLIHMIHLVSVKYKVSIQNLV